EKDENEENNSNDNIEENTNNNESDDDSDNESANEENTNKKDLSKKLQHVKKLQASMNSDDMSSQEITLGSKTKGTSLVVKAGKKSTFVDDLSLGTVDDNESVAIKLKAESSYKKSDLEEIAGKHNINIP